jgi:predicted small secreted protein
MTGPSWGDAKRRFVRAWSPVALALAAITLAACNTARGIGRAVGAAGRVVTGTADRATPR